MLCIDPTALDAGIVCGSPDPALLVDLQTRPQLSMLDMDCFFYPDILSQQPPSYYEQQWSETPSIFTPSPDSIASVASVNMLNSSQSRCISDMDYTFGYDPNNYSSLRDAGAMHAYMTPTSMTPFSAYSFA